MRINLVTPFAEKDAAKALGARWDSSQKVWYVADVADLAPFARWIPDMAAAICGDTVASTQAQPAKAQRAPLLHGKGAAITRATVDVQHCGCDVLPWEDCAHTVKVG